MFEVKTLVEGKKLEKLLWALDGLVLGKPEITPVRGAVAHRGKIKSSQPVPGGSVPDQVAAMIAKARATFVTAQDLMDLTQRAGAKRGSYYYVVRKLTQAKVLGPVKAGKYPVK